MSHDERIRWAQSVSRAKLWRLYQSDALGIVDKELIDEVGVDLYARCESILMASNADVQCPRCGTVFHVGWEHDESNVIACPADHCSWKTTYLRYHNSWRRQRLIGQGIQSALRTFMKQYRQARRPQDKMFLIDQLIQVYHYDLKTGEPKKPGAHNLIDGTYTEIVAFLDRLAYGSARSSEGQETKEAPKPDY
jgi:hypothetical protein